MKKQSLIDQHNRHLNYLRVSVTDRCNLRCSYCLPTSPFAKLPHKEILRYEEILRLIRLAVSLGISKLRVTGGEPLIRKGIYNFLEELGTIKGLTDISLTTNGILLKDHINQIQAAGIGRINISLDTLKRDKYQQITGRDRFLKVWDSIQAALQMGFEPIKINVVALKGINDDELQDLARLSFDYPFHIRFIEYMPIGNVEVNPRQNLLTPDIKKHLSALGKLVPIARDVDDGPAERFRFEGAPGEIGFISALSHHFCHQCNRLRLTASGQLRTCLLSSYQVDLKNPLRLGYSDNQLAQILLEAVQHKTREHNIAKKTQTCISSRMSAIGG